MQLSMSCPPLLWLGEKCPCKYTYVRMYIARDQVPCQILPRLSFTDWWNIVWYSQCFYVPPKNLYCSGDVIKLIGVSCTINLSRHRTIWLSRSTQCMKHYTYVTGILENRHNIYVFISTGQCPCNNVKN